MKKLTILNSRFVLLVLLVLLGASFSSTAFAQEQKKELNNSAPVESLTAKVDKLFAQWDKPNSPGCALGIVKDGSFVYKRGYGMANLDYNIPISPDTSFYIASTSKQFTAMSIALLARDGKISLDDDIHKYLPEIPQYQSTITIRHLIHHTSGIRDYLELTPLAGRYTEDINTEEDFMRLIARQKNLNFKPGEEYSYSNSNYFLLSQIVKRVSGKSLRKFADERIFKTLGMVNTFFHDDRREIIKNRASGHFPVGSGGFSVVFTNFEGVGDGGLYTSVEDLLLWDRNFYDNKLGGGADLINQILTPRALNNGDKNDYAFALTRIDYKGLKMIGHGGSFIGFRAQMFRFPEQKFSVICLCNSANIDPTNLVKRVADIYLDEQIKQAAGGDSKTTVSETVFLKSSEQELNDFVGFYFDPLAVISRRIIVKDGKLMAVRGTNSNELQAIGENRFRVTGIPSKIELSFKSPKPGAMKNMYLAIDNGKPTLYEGFKPASYTPEDLSKFAGTFYSDELDAKYVLSFKENKLMVKKVGSEEVPLEALSTDAFTSSQGQGLIIRFKRDKQNRISGFSMTASSVRGIVFSKI